MNDYDYALKIVDGKKFDYGDDFDCMSFIYQISNEKLKQYKYLLQGKKVLSVVASGDQIIEMIDNGVKNFDCFDVSIFPEYYLMLKLAALQTLSLGEYTSLFISSHDSKYDKNLKEIYYELIRKELDYKYREFWDKLLKNHEWSKIFKSDLFTDTRIELHQVINRFDFLNNYKELKNKVNKINITFKDCNIIEGYKDFKGDYDLVYLSNILDYVNPEDFKSMLDSLPLSEQGKVISYIFNKTAYYENLYKEDNYQFCDIYSDTISKPSVLVYKR